LEVLEDHQVQELEITTVEADLVDHRQVVLVEQAVVDQVERVDQQVPQELLELQQQQTLAVAVEVEAAQVGLNKCHQEQFNLEQTEQVATVPVELCIFMLDKEIQNV
jgi:hypothetical protein